MSSIDSTKSTDERQAALSQAINQKMAEGKFRIESRSDFDAVLVRGRKTNHLLHLLLTFLTFGLWMFVWPVVWLINRETRLFIEIDPWGRANITHL